MWKPGITDEIWDTAPKTTAKHTREYRHKATLFKQSNEHLPYYYPKKTITEYGNMNFYPGKFPYTNQLRTERSVVMRKVTERQKNNPLPPS